MTFIKDETVLVVWKGFHGSFSAYGTVAELATYKEDGKEKTSYRVIFPACVTFPNNTVWFAWWEIRKVGGNLPADELQTRKNNAPMPRWI